VTLPIGSIAPLISILPVLVFLSETCVVTLSTIRTIFIARGMKAPAAFLGFFEVSVWLFAIGQVMQNLNSPDCFLAFASGFSLGNFLGVLIEKKLALGSVAVHITTTKDACCLIEGLRSAGYGVTALDAQGMTGPVQVVFSVIPRKELGNVVALIKSFDPRVFYSVNDLQHAAAGFVSPGRGLANHPVPAPLQQIYQGVISLRSSIAATPLRAFQDTGAEKPDKEIRTVGHGTR
jgi:uncharacterized protein YebE (UPF0316 family)